MSTLLAGAANRPRRSRAVTEVTVLIPLVIAVAAVFTTTQSEYVVFVLNTILMATIGALALTMLMGTAGQVSIGQAAFLAVGAFSAVFALDHGVAFPFDVVVSAGVAALVGLVVAVPAIRLRGIYLAFSTLAAHFIVLYIAERYQSSSVGFGAFSVEGLFTDAGIDGQQRRWTWLLAGVVCVVLVLAARLMSFKSGRAWNMVRDHEVVAPALGIDVTRYKLGVFVLSSAIIGAQGGLMAHFTGVVSVDSFSLLLAISYISMVVIGGLDSPAGACVGATVVVALPRVVPDVIDWVGVGNSGVRAPYVSQITYGVLVVIVATRFPDGVVAAVRRSTSQVQSLTQSLIRKGRT